MTAHNPSIQKTHAQTPFLF